MNRTVVITQILRCSNHAWSLPPRLLCPSPPSSSLSRLSNSVIPELSIYIFFPYKIIMVKTRWFINFIYRESNRALSRYADKTIYFPIPTRPGKYWHVYTNIVLFAENQIDNTFVLCNRHCSYIRSKTICKPLLVRSNWYAAIYISFREF